MKVILTILYLFSFLISKNSNADGDFIDAQVEVARIQLMDLRSGFELGESDGYATFGNELLTDCAYITIQGERISTLLNRLIVYQQFAPRGYFNTGYYAGWLIGFRRAYNEDYDSCRDQLDQNTQTALQERLSQCRRISHVYVNDTTLVNDFSILKETEVTQVQSKELLTLVLIGNGDEAWNKLLGADRKHVFSIPCYIIMLEAIISHIERRL